jgi:C-terminal processing protease CtpA/Prc
MKKFLIILFFLIIVVLLIFIYFPKNLKNNAGQQLVNTPTDKISQTSFPPILGIHYKIIDNQTATQNKLVEGAYITQVIKDSPADKAKLQEEDIITEIDNREISKLDQQSIYKLISALKPGSQIKLLIWRNNTIKPFLVNLK